MSRPVQASGRKSFLGSRAFERFMVGTRLGSGITKSQKFLNGLAYHGLNASFLFKGTVIEEINKASIGTYSS